MGSQKREIWERLALERKTVWETWECGNNHPDKITNLSKLPKLPNLTTPQPTEQYYHFLILARQIQRNTPIKRWQRAFTHYAEREE